MANEEHVAQLKKGAVSWNAWRQDNPDIRLDLREADLRSADLTGAYLVGANFRRADLSRADLSGADLTRANFSEWGEPQRREVAVRRR
jgi:uncharacterized protein YjbI with pentapeptide repeats